MLLLEQSVDLQSLGSVGGRLARAGAAYGFSFVELRNGGNLVHSNLILHIYICDCAFFGGMDFYFEQYKI